MGLDMYALAVSKHEDNTDFTFVQESPEEFHYWRKFNALHGWMHQLAISKGLKEEFNCNPLRLTKEDLDNLESQMHNLKPVQGFFFGEQRVYPEDIESLEVFIKKARIYLDDGFEVYYDSWW